MKYNKLKIVDNKQHKPGCMTNLQCLVYHPDGVCPGPYGQCTCSYLPETQKIEVTLGKLTPTTNTGVKN